jgi:DNA-binding LytR/AlgR family response regulator
MTNKKLKVIKKNTEYVSNDTFLLFVDVANSNEIIKLESDINYTILYFRNGIVKRSAYTLMRFEELLQGNSNYIRINRATIININFIKEIDFVEKQIKIDSGEIVNISRRKLEKVRSQCLILSPNKIIPYLSIENMVC